jgi:glycyl-tRNA synthetase beta chain
MSLRFLLEIGAEEVPDWMIEPALDHLRQLFTEVLTEHNLGGTVEQMDATPRRLVLRASNLRDKQADEVKEMLGAPDLGGRGRGKWLRKEDGREAGRLAEGPDTQGRILLVQPRRAGAADT